MSLQESEETLSAITQLQKKMETGQGIFEKANEDLKVLQRDLRDKQIALNTLRENLQEQDNDASQLLEKLWKQQDKIKGHLAAQSSDEIIQAIQEQNEFIDSELELITQQSEKIVSNLTLYQEFEQFLREDGKDIDNIDIERRKKFAKFLEGNELLTEDDKKELFKENSQLMVELNASMQNLEERETYLIKQQEKLQNKDLADNLTAYVQPELQKLFEERQAEIEKDIKDISEQEPILAKQYANIILQEKEIKTIQDQIEQKTKIIEQSKQHEEQWFEKLKQLEEQSPLPLSSAKQQQEDPVSNYSILQERANDVEASVQRQIEINELIKQQKELTGVEKARADNLDQQLKQLQLSTEEKIQANQKLINDLQDEIIGLKAEKEQKQFSMPTNEENLAYELRELGESDGSWSSQIEELTDENDALKAQLKEVAKQLKSEQQEKQVELQKAKEELTGTSEKLLEAERLHEKGSKQAKELQAQLGGLTNENNSLKTQLEEIDNAKEQLEILSGKKDVEYNYLEVEYETQQAELKKMQQELTEFQEELTLEKLISDEQYDQNKNFKTQLNKVTDENAGLKSQLEKIKEDTKNQLETLSARKDLEYNALVTKQKGDIDELWRRLEVAQEHAQRIQKDEQARVTEFKDKDVRIAELEAKNATLLEQLKKLQIKPEVQGSGIQTDEIAGQEKTSVSTETESIIKEFKAVDSQTDNRQKLYQSVGTEYRPSMDSGVSTEEVATNATKVIVQEQTVTTSIEEQTVDKVLVQNKTKGNVDDDDKILQAFKELSREQVQPIVNKFSLESTSSFAQFAQENVGALSKALRDSKVLREIENIEQRGYTDIHKKFASEYKDIEWQEKASGKSFSLQQNGQDVVTINETTLNHDDKNAKYKTSEGEEIKNARMVNIPLSIDMKGACHMSFAVQDTNGRNISKEDAVYLTAHYKNGKLVHLTKPTEIFSCSDDNKSPLYLKRKGKTYTLPVDKSTLEQLEQEVLKNKGEYVGIVKNTQGQIRVNSAGVQGLQQPVTADSLFKEASQLLHDANATPALDGSLDMKGLAHKKPNRNVGGRNP